MPEIEVVAENFWEYSLLLKRDNLPVYMCNFHCPNCGREHYSSHAPGRFEAELWCRHSASGVEGKTPALPPDFVHEAQCIKDGVVTKIKVRMPSSPTE